VMVLVRRWLFLMFEAVGGSGHNIAIAMIVAHGDGS